MTVLEFLPIETLNRPETLVYLAASSELNSDELELEDKELSYINQQLKNGVSHVELIAPGKILFVFPSVVHRLESERDEQWRRRGAKLLQRLNALKISSLVVASESNPSAALLFAEGMALAGYKFTKYKKEAAAPALRIGIASAQNLQKEVAELNIVLEAVYKTRHLVNEPVLYLTAEQLGTELIQLGHEAGFHTEVFNKSKIQSLKMGGLLAVNTGSPNPPTFSVLEYKPENAVNTQPIVLVGKGVVYDTGGLSLKPTEHSMDMMKCDMAGAGAVAGVFYAAAQNKLPVHLIGLIPATENRPDGNAVTPGDIITMHSGTTVEVLNTDAEGRLILADALSYATRYEPELVIDLATLTGAAVRALGKEAIAYMGTASEDIKAQLETAGSHTFERLVELPLWDDYNEHILSDIADLKNVGGSEAGAITAGKFLEHFTTYPWLHLDIAAGAFMTSGFHYWPKGGTGIGVRLLYQYLKQRVQK
jgi:leucyl aminopeptidase